MAKQVKMVLRAFMVVVLLVSLSVIVPSVGADVSAVQITSPTSTVPASVTTLPTNMGTTYNVTTDKTTTLSVSYFLVGPWPSTTEIAVGSATYPDPIVGTNYYTTTAPLPSGLVDGRYDFVIKAKQGPNFVEKVVTSTASVFIDTVAPTLTITPFLGIDNWAHPTQFEGTFADATSGIEVVELKLETPLPSWVAATIAGTSGMTVGTWISNTLPSMTDGTTYTLTVRARDRVGNQTTAPVIPFKYDGTDPTVSISTTSPITESFTQFTGSASDAHSGVDKVELTIKKTVDTTGYYWNGSAWITTETKLLASGTNVWSYAVDRLAAFADGEMYTVTAIATDKAGNTKSATKSITYDIAPRVHITPIPDYVGVATLGNIGGVALDAEPSHVLAVEVQLRNSADRWWDGTSNPAVFTSTVPFTITAWLTAPTGSDITYTWTITTAGVQFPQDTYTVRARAKDDQGRTTDWVEESFIFDATPPTISMVDLPANCKPGVFRGTASDGGSGVEEVQVRLRGPSGLDSDWVTVSGTNVWISYTTGIPWVSGGTYTVTAKAKDGAGNWSEPVTDTFTYSGVYLYGVRLYRGWNLISSPLIPSDTTIETVLAELIARGTVHWADSFFWAGGVLGEKKWQPPVIRQLTEIVDGQGYWVKMYQADDLVFIGLELPEPPAVPPSYPVYGGWNMIGFKSLTPKSASAYLGDDLSAILRAMYGYDAQQGLYFTVQQTTELQPGQGFWAAFSGTQGTVVGTIYP